MANFFLFGGGTTKKTMQIQLAVTTRMAQDWAPLAAGDRRREVAQL